MKNLMKRSLSCLALGIALGWTPSILAADDLSLDRFQPSLPGDRFFGVEGADPGGHALPRITLLGDYAYRPLTLYRDPNNTKVGDVVANQLVGHLSLGVSLWDRLVLAVNVPVTLFTNGNTFSVTGPDGSEYAFAPPKGMALGDIRVSARGRLLGEARSAFSLSLAGHLFVPTGNKEKLAGGGVVHGSPVLVVSGETDSIAYAVTGGVDVRKEELGKFAVGTQMIFGGAVGALLMKKTLQIGPEVYGSTLMAGTEKFKKATTSIEAILGLRARLSDFVIGAGAGPGFTHGAGTPVLRVLLSATYAPEPSKPAPPPPPVKKKRPPADRDKDGIPDKVDACPDEPGVASDDPAKNGCPLPPPDRDGDGIIDSEDSCPDVKGVKSSNPTENGCPPDTDGDGIRDDVDACPNEKGVPDTDPSKNGCPKSVRVTDGEIVILDQVQFKTGSAVILPVSDDLLRQVAAVLVEHPEIAKVEVQGHTDNRGGKAYNRKLSQKRADAVKKWLVNYGQIDGGRLSARGYGPDEPLSDNLTPEGRQKNRRVQFKILEKTNR
jgi:OmpA-OmpF porin, OOP family